ncbi:MAG: hypothetical protein WC658_05345, partial [Candidatus Omnitrophota bacterium]
VGRLGPGCLAALGLAIAAPQIHASPSADKQPQPTAISASQTERDIRGFLDAWEKDFVRYQEIATELRLKAEEGQASTGQEQDNHYLLLKELSSRENIARVSIWLKMPGLTPLLRQRLTNIYRLMLQLHIEADPEIWQLNKRYRDDHYNAAGSRLSREEKKGIFVESVKRRNALAREFGFKDYLDLRAINVSWLRKVIAQVKEITEEGYVEHVAKMRQLRQENPGLIEPPDLVIPDVYFPQDKIQQYFWQTLRLLGRDTAELENKITWLKRGGALEAYCARLPEGKILVKSAGHDGLNAWRNTFHEAGHAVSWLFSTVDPNRLSILDYRPEVNEGLAMFFEHYIFRLQWHRQMYGNLAPELDRLPKIAANILVRRPRGLGFITEFELSVYENPNQDLDALAERLCQSYSVDSRYYSLIGLHTLYLEPEVGPLYSPRHFLGSLLAVQLEAYCQEEFGGVLNPAAGKWLKKRCLNPELAGNTFTLTDWLKQAIGQGSISTQPLADRLKKLPRLGPLGPFALGALVARDPARTRDGEELPPEKKDRLNEVAAVAFASSKGFRTGFTTLNYFDHITPELEQRLITEHPEFAQTIQAVRRGRIRAGPEALFEQLDAEGIELFGFNHNGFVILNPAYPEEYTRTIIHEIAAIAKWPHEAAERLAQQVDKGVPGSESRSPVDRNKQREKRIGDVVSAYGRFVQDASGQFRAQARALGFPEEDGIPLSGEVTLEPSYLEPLRQSISAANLGFSLPLDLTSPIAFMEVVKLDIYLNAELFLPGGTWCWTDFYTGEVFVASVDESIAVTGGRVPVYFVQLAYKMALEDKAALYCGRYIVVDSGQFELWRQNIERFQSHFSRIDETQPQELSDSEYLRWLVYSSALKGRKSDEVAGEIIAEIIAHEQAEAEAKLYAAEKLGLSSEEVGLPIHPREVEIAASIL